MAKPAQAKKIRISAKAAAAVLLALAFALTVVFSVLGITGTNLDRDGLYKLLPWVPSVGGASLWRQALVPGADFGETASLTYSYQQEEDAPAGEEALERTIGVLSRRLLDWGWADAAVEKAEAGKLRITLPGAEAGGGAALLAGAPGEFAFASPGGEVFLTGDHIVSAGYGPSQQEGVYALSFALDEEGKTIFGEKTAELIGQSISLLLDGEELTAPSVSEALDEGGASIPGFTEEEARNYAVLMRSGALPLTLALEGSAPGAPLFGDRAAENLILAMAAAMLLIAAYLVTRYRLGGLIASWTLLIQYVAICFFAALAKSGYSVATLLAVYGSYALAVFAILMIFHGMKSDIDRGRSVKQALRDSYGRAGRASLDILVGLLFLAVVIMIMDTGTIGSFMRLFSVGLLTNLLLVHIALRVLMVQAINLFGERTSLYTKNTHKKEAV